MKKKLEKIGHDEIKVQSVIGMFLSKYGGQEADFDSHLLPTRRSDDVVAINWLVLLTANDNNVNDLQRKLS